ncbi:uncharacterized protein LOC119334297 [Triticum dicoccoides]|uniref:uncharacterized protein LOC119334297 n=1 Tax=Triticum dicoccoides TaxID=85692 RepID=UPI001891312D|nr:uncharacterized protein LOC119334297 [Triticum dicoccoides]
MASPPAKKKPPTTIRDLDQDTLREILFRLPSLPSLVRAALSCRAFLDAIRSSPAFRRRFRALHPPPLLGLFLSIEDAVIPSFVPLRRRPDPDLAAAVRGADLFLTRLPVPEDDISLPWSICDCREGFVLLGNWSTEQMAVYNPLTRTLDLIPLPPRESRVGSHIDFYILASEQDYRSFRIVCVRHSKCGALAIVFSSDTRKWKIFPWTDIDGFWPQHGKVVNGCIYWTIGMPTDARVLNTATMQFFRMDMPPRGTTNETLTAGETKDGRLCVVFAPIVALRPESALVVWILRADAGDAVERWMLEKSLPLQEVAGIVRCQVEENVKVQLSVDAIIDGFVYLSAYCGAWEHHHSTHWFLSYCVERAVLKKLDRILYDASYPYIMPWPRSLVHSKPTNIKLKAM